MIINISCNFLKEGYVQTENSEGIYYPFFPTASMAIKREDFDSVGGFDPRLFTGEDIDLCIKLQKANKTLWYERDSVVYHQHRAKLKELLKQFYYYGYYHPLVYENHEKSNGIKFFNLKKINVEGEEFLEFSRFLFLPFFFKGMIFLNYWIPTVIFFLLSLFSYYLGNILLGHLFLFGSLFFYYLVMYRWVGLDKLKLRAEMIYVQTLMDIVYFWGGFVGGLKRGMLYMEASARDLSKLKMDFDIDETDESIIEVREFLSSKKK